MKFMTIRSGSKANCIYINNGGYGILIDAGEGIRATEAALRETCGHGLERIAAIFITHEHIDHIRGLEVITRKYPMPVFANSATLNSIVSRLPGVNTDNFRPMPSGGRAACPDMRVTSFRTSHDAAESVGYVITDGVSTISVVTDLGYISREILGTIRGSNAVVLESNYDEDMLRHGPYPVALKRRILSEHGHLSNDSCAVTASVLAQNGTRRIVLAHLSENNNIPAIARRTTEDALTADGLCVGGDIMLEVASRYNASALMDV